MRQLAPGEARFLYADDDHANSNVTLVMIYDPSGAPDGRLRFKRLLEHVASRLHRLPLFRRRLQRVPLDLDLPYWVEDERFDLEYHVRNIALPEPGDWRQFCIQASRIHARALDLARPLWELYLVERLDAFDELPPHSVAVLLKLHHAAVDLEHGADVAMLLHDLVPDAGPPGPPEPWFAESPPAGVDLLLRALGNATPFAGARPVVRALTRLGPGILKLTSEALLNPDAAPTARFNAEVSPHRVFDSRRFALEQLERIRGLVRGASLDDVLLAVCGGGLRRYLEAQDELPRQSLLALAPPSVHGVAGFDAGEEAFRRVPLGTDEADPVRRLRAIRRATGPRRAARPTVRAPQDAPARGLAVTARSLGAAAAAAGRGLPIANCTIANVPGPGAPRFLCGARLSYFSALMPVADGLGLTLAVTSFDGRVLVSATACREQLPDPECLARCIRESFEEYLALTRRRARRPASRTAATAAARRAGTAATRPPAARGGRPRSTSRAD